ncbi:ester cyclase [Dactylosporangium aurantiacum]|uniref:Ester cyclase n=1 Tax=Dactylosporangium aurantiacum TaxID=35754 RepID=A0A9Q9IAD0_9ACTN|nr:ester cyclase [Dactylosporangium aurantiacum]MDG6107066.1 ester cyclase [Dactylosporangium aurantiacum]UWZ51366.1 ester cyclase [Dactylosporangium aurantiacum]
MGDATREQMVEAYVRVWIGELWNLGDPAGGRVLAEDFHDHRPIEQFPNTREGHIAMAVDWHQAFPDMTFVIEDVMVESNKLVARYRAAGTHLGVLSGIPGTGRGVELTGIDIMGFRGREIVEWWHNEDINGLMSQITAP